MRRFISVKLLLIYFVATFGATIQMHFCQGQMIEMNVSALSNNLNQGCCSNVDDACAESDSDHESGCCNDIELNVAVNDQQLLNSSLIQLFSAVDFTTYFPSPFFKNNISSKLISQYPIIEKPKIGLWQDIPLYILFSQKRFGNC